MYLIFHAYTILWESTRCSTIVILDTKISMRDSKKISKNDIEGDGVQINT